MEVPTLESSPIAFLHEVGRLKTLKRRGWKLRGIPNPESVADHSFRVALMGCFASDGLDELKCMRMGLIHDMAESVVGDITPKDGVSKEEKHKREDFGFRYHESLLGAYGQRHGFRDLWLEYDAGKTPESQFVKGCDKIECLLQIIEYERETGKKILETFEGLVSEIELPQLTRLVDDLLQEREAFWLKQETPRTPVIFVIGGPGVGKGTQCAQLAKEFGFQHISLGEVLREKSNDSTYRHAKFVKESLEEVVVVPPSLANSLLEMKIWEGTQGKTWALLDGFPRSLEQVTGWEKEVQIPYYAILLDCPPEEMFQRTQTRGQTSGRLDDKPEIVRKRLQYEEKNSEMLHHLQERAAYFKRIDASGTIDEVYNLLKEEVQKIMKISDAEK